MLQQCDLLLFLTKKPEFFLHKLYERHSITITIWHKIVPENNRHIINKIMTGIVHFKTFILAGLLLNLTPGNDTFLYFMCYKIALTNRN